MNKIKKRLKKRSWLIYVVLGFVAIMGLVAVAVLMFIPLFEPAKPTKTWPAPNPFEMESRETGLGAE